ncbi:MAG: hypothetical protein ACYTFH_07740 [Planctomycetota bacterium]
MSFFSFQDVMMCTIGLTIMVTLMLILQIGSSTAAIAESDEDRTDPRLAEVDRRLAELEDRLVELDRLDDLDPNRELAGARAELLALAEGLAASRARVESAERRLEDALREASLDPRSSIAIDLMRRRDALAEAIADARRRKRITYLVAEADALPPTVVELAGTRAVISFDAESEAPQAVLATDPERLADRVLAVYTGRPDWRDRYLLVVLKPSGVATWEAIRRRLREDPAFSSVSTGLDLLPETQWTTDAFPPPRGDRR